ncbi:MAG: hypothetical protein IOB85_15180 [Methylobacterium sp.]|nr:hypothetical protein [Methylobacterium sp.]MCA3665850.1 hypothetical protein [Methylobacterium sp.]MCA3668150.1 hypothetical protein [Methylobacterium sp.]MCA3674536.1 hypothetical protein [Methylobacterium sp.]MCA3682274.1 hypothetical protein [Methylobacterium sp.]
MTKSALNSDLAVSARAAGATAPAAEQLDFLAPVAERINRADADAIAANAAEERKRGRPKGAENLSSRQLREMIVRAGGHPLIHLARWATMTPEELATRLGCSVADAFDRQVAIWDKLAPYVAAKLAPTDEKGNAVPGLVISIGDQAINAGLGVSAGGSPPWLAAYRDADGRVIEGVEIQGVSGSRADVTDQEGGS